jgi:hypothetical protein
VRYAKQAGGVAVGKPSSPPPPPRPCAHTHPGVLLLLRGKSDADVVLLHAHEPAVDVRQEPAIGVCWQLLQTDEPEMGVRVLHAPPSRASRLTERKSFYPCWMELPPWRVSPRTLCYLSSRCPPLRHLKRLKQAARSTKRDQHRIGCVNIEQTKQNCKLVNDALT